MQKIVPNLWFDSNAEEAVGFYTSVFKNSRVTNVSRYGQASAEVAGKPEGTVMVVSFELEGQQFMAISGGPEFKFTPAISLLVNCETQEEIDALWAKLTEGGEELPCGWLTDKYGVSWQIVPALMDELMQSGDPKKTENMMKAMLPMKKLDLDALKRAYAQG